MFKFSRITSIECLNEKFEPLNYPTSEEKIEFDYPQIKLSFSKEVAYRIYDEFEESDISEQADGHFIVTACMPEDNWLIGYILSFGADVEILEPSHLRIYVAEIAKKVYEKNKP